MSNPCSKCEVSCCSAYSVFVAFQDLIPIARTLKIPFLRFAGFTLFEKSNDCYSPYAFYLGKGKKFLLNLRKKYGRPPKTSPSVRFTGTRPSLDGRCVFLMRFGKTGRCGIHGMRPMVCRCYPFFEENGNLTEVPGKLCPVEWIPGKRDSISFKRDLKKFHSNYRKFGKLVYLWNNVEFKKISKDSGENHEKNNFRRFLDFCERKSIDQF